MSKELIELMGKQVILRAKVSDKYSHEKEIKEYLIAAINNESMTIESNDEWFSYSAGLLSELHIIHRELIEDESRLKALKEFTGFCPYRMVIDRNIDSLYQEARIPEVR